MRLFLSTLALVALTTAGGWAKDPPKTAAKGPAAGVKTPGVLIPYASLKSEAELKLDSAPTGFFFNDAVTIAETTGVLRRFDAKTNKPFEPSRDVKDVAKPCGGLVNAFSSLWTLSCGTPSLAKVDLPAAPERGRPAGGRGGMRAMAAKPDGDAKADPAKAEEKPAEAPKPDLPKPEPPKPPAPPKPTVFIGLESTPAARTALAASEDSVWLLADGKTSLQRIDPVQNKVVAELRLPSACQALLYAEAALWVACPGETKLLKIDPKTNLVEKRIEVAAQPVALAAGEGSIWVLGKKDGKITRVDPKTNKSSATIDLAIPNADGTLAFGEGSLWASVLGFPVMRIAPSTDKVVQQFHGEGGGWIAVGAGSVWVASEKSATVVRFDPKRIQATLAE